MMRITAKLRLLATTDLHMNLLGFDYATDSQALTNGIAGISTLVAKARAMAQAGGRAVVLLDNGDFLQGTALADWHSTRPPTKDHPIIRAFNAMQYDAVGLGNHDLDYGTTYLATAIKGLDSPAISTNLACGALAGVRKHIMIARQVRTTQGTSEGTATLNIGVVSALPIETAIWNKLELPDDATIQDPLVSIADAAALLRARGADLVIALAHMGIGPSKTANTCGNSGAAVLAQLPDIDVVIAGHTHQRHPQGDAGETVIGTACPIVMPGYAGADLGVIDLDLERGADGKWRIAQQRTALRPNTNTVAADRTITKISAPAHHATRDYLSETIAEISHDLHSYFGMVCPSDAHALSARAKAIEVRQALATTPFGQLPLLATATARAAGGPNGPTNYIHIPKGPVLRRHLANFAPSTNRTCAMLVTGDTLRNWLEHSASVYRQISTDAPEQPLLDHTNPSFIFDTIYGLDYRIDPSRPVGQRITTLHHDSKAVTPDQRFVLATNHFRAAGGGGYSDLNLPAPLFQSDLSPVQGFVQALQSDDLAEWTHTAPWRLNCSGRCKAVFECSPLALRYFDQIRTLSPEILGHTETGFDRVQITL